MRSLRYLCLCHLHQLPRIDIHLPTRRDCELDNVLKNESFAGRPSSFDGAFLRTLHQHHFRRLSFKRIQDYGELCASNTTRFDVWSHNQQLHSPGIRHRSDSFVIPISLPRGSSAPLTPRSRLLVKAKLKNSSDARTTILIGVTSSSTH